MKQTNKTKISPKLSRYAKNSVRERNFCALGGKLNKDTYQSTYLFRNIKKLTLPVLKISNRKNSYFVCPIVK